MVYIIDFFWKILKKIIQRKNRDSLLLSTSLIKPTLGDQRKKSEKRNFFRSDGGGTFFLHFWNLH